jgi:hypothetical protein
VLTGFVVLVNNYSADRHEHNRGHLSPTDLNRDEGSIASWCEEYEKWGMQRPLGRDQN